MVAYDFQARFAPMVEDGRKNQTIRGDRKRHARVGKPVQLYTGRRTKGSRKLRDPDPTCLICQPVSITSKMVLIGDLERTGRRALLLPDELNGFARADGFDDFDAMLAWFADTHGLPFSGWLIGWTPPNRGFSISFAGVGGGGSSDG